MVTARNAAKVTVRKQLQAARARARALKALDVVDRYLASTDAWSESITHVNAIAQLIDPSVTKYGC